MSAAPGIIDYHRPDRHWSSTMVRAFIADPATAWRRYIAKSESWDESSPALRIGAGIHACLAGWPGSPVPMLYRCSAQSISSTAYREAVERFSRTAVVLLAPEYDRVGEIFTSIMKLQTPAADLMRALAEDELTEHVVRWNHAGLPCKTALDKVSYRALRITEWKTCEDPSPQAFRWDMKKYRYDLQAAHLRAGAESEVGVKLPVFFVAISKASPFRVAVHEIGESWMEKADEEWRVATTELAGLVANSSNDAAAWVAPWEKQVNAIRG